MQLDYKALNEPVTDEMVRTYASDETKWLDKKTIIAAGVILLVFIGGPLFVGDAMGAGISIATIAKLLIAAVIALGVLAAAAYGAKLQAKTTVRLKRFAEANNAIFTKDVKSPSLAGMIFNQGHSRRLDESLAFDNGIEIGNFTYVTGSGKNQSTHTYAFIRVALNRNLPHMVLDAKSNNFLGSNLPDVFSSDQQLTLEGDFNNYFSVFAPKDYERDALYVFTPDVMQVLVDKGAKHDMEIIGNELFIFKGGRFKLDSQLELESLVDVASSISSELRDQSKRYTDERTSERYVATTQDGKMPQVAAGGQRLKQRSPVYAIIFFVLLVVTVFAPAVLPAEISDIFLAVMWPLVFVMAISFAVMDFMRRR